MSRSGDRGVAKVLDEKEWDNILGEPSVALSRCTIDVFKRNDEQVVIDIFLFRFLFGQSDMRDFWIDIGAPRHDRIIHFLPQKLEWNKNVSHNYARLRIGHVCKQEWPDYIAYTVNMPLRRL